MSTAVARAQQLDGARERTLGKQGRPKKGEEKGDNVTLKDRGNSSAYILARLDRDRPKKGANGTLKRGSTSRAAQRQRRAAKQRLWRQRQAAGISIYPLPLGHDMLNKLIEVGLLGVDESANVGEVTKAVLDLMGDYFKARRV